MTIKFSGTMTVGGASDVEWAKRIALKALPAGAFVEAIATDLTPAEQALADAGTKPLTAAEANAHPDGRWGEGGRNEPK